MSAPAQPLPPLTLPRVRAIGQSKHLATTAPLNDIMAIAASAAAMAEMLQDLRAALDAAQRQDCAIASTSLLAWLDAGAKDIPFLPQPALEPRHAD